MIHPSEQTFEQLIESARFFGRPDDWFFREENNPGITARCRAAGYTPPVAERPETR